MVPSLFNTLKKNYTYLRYLEHELISDIKLKGKFIDLGAKSDTERYYEYLDMTNVSEVNFCDIVSQSANVKKINLEEKFDIDDEEYETIIYFNVLEHIYNYKNLIDETFRILKTGGVAHVIVPFMHRYHGDPDDFNRFTYTALYRKYRDAGFTTVQVTPIGSGRFNVIAMYLSTIFKNRFYRYAIIKLFRGLQSFEKLISNKTHHFCLAYYVEAKK